MENLVALVNKVQRACTALEDHGEESALPLSGTRRSTFFVVRLPWLPQITLFLPDQPLVDDVAIAEMDFTQCAFWVQIHGLPVEKMSRANAKIIGQRLGKLLAVEGASEGLLLYRSFLRIRVEINVNNSLPKGFWLRRKAGTNKDIWISYKYEKLSDYCYACGRIGHDNRSCKFVSREDGSNSGHGPELCTGRAWKSDAPIIEIWQQGRVNETGVEVSLERRLSRRIPFHTGCIPPGLATLLARDLFP